MIGSMLLVSTALAFNWDSSDAAPGNSLTWHLCDDEFTAGEATEIIQASNSWDAGTGEILRGAIWDFTKGADRDDCSVDNGYNEVFTRSQAWFEAQGMGIALGAMMHSPGTDWDFIFNLGYTWTTDMPSDAANDEYSIGQVAFHEFGHAIGFNHEETVIATMNSVHPTGGNFGDFYRPHEDDYAGLVANRPHASTGRTLMLNRFVETTSGRSKEIWDYGDSNWEDLCGVVESPDGPEEIYAVILGTAAQSPLIRWTVSSDTTCFDDDDFEVGTSIPTIASDEPFLVHPNPYDFTDVPNGPYYLCAKIDADNEISETSETENAIRSEVQLEVYCP